MTDTDYVLVPREATDAMMYAYYEARGDAADATWRAMLAAWERTHPAIRGAAEALAHAQGTLPEVRVTRFVGPQWRDIDTAPKDGTKVLLWTGGPEPAIDFWDCGWGDCGWDNPTHWMPLPEAPAGSPGLNRPLRSRDEAAFDRLRCALARIGRTSRDEASREDADKALADVAALLGEDQP